MTAPRLVKRKDPCRRASASCHRRDRSRLILGRLERPLRRCLLAGGSGNQPGTADAELCRSIESLVQITIAGMLPRADVRCCRSASAPRSSSPHSPRPFRPLEVCLWPVCDFCDSSPPAAPVDRRFRPKASLSAQGSGLSTHCYAATAARSENIPLAVAAFHLSLLPGSDHGSASGTSLRNTGRSVVGGEAGI
jgi:hypothetical protein